MAFPELSLDMTILIPLPRTAIIVKYCAYHITGKTWRDLSNRKVFFEKLAYKKGFDPLVPTNWFGLSTTEVLDEKVRDM